MAPFILAVAIAAMQAGGFRIVVVEGEDAVNVVQQKTAVAPVIEVRDKNDQPVAGAIVRFAIRQGRGTFAGARTLTVTTNAAGRAVASGLTPTGTGVLRIGASAAFQGQTAVATITQTNVMTAAEAATASSGASAAGGGAAGGGGSGGMSMTTLGVVGGAAAGAAVVATQVGGGTAEEAKPVVSTYRGSFSAQSLFNSTTTTNGVVTGFCANQAVTLSGTVTVTLNERGAGEITIDWTEAVAASGLCPATAPSFHASGAVSSPTSISLTYDSTGQFQSPAGTVRDHRADSFVGALTGDVITGKVTMSQDHSLIAPIGPGVSLVGGYPEATAAVTLNKQ